MRPSAAGGNSSSEDLRPGVLGELRVQVSPAAGRSSVPTPQQDRGAQPPASRVPGSVERPIPGDFEGPHIRCDHPDGQILYEAQQRKDSQGVWVLHGHWTAWHENGGLHEDGAYSMGKEDGLWEWWDPNGTQTARGHFVQGKREGAWTFWFPDGVKMADANYRDGKGEGPWTLFHENGQRRAQGNFADEEIAGYWTIWNENGEVNGDRTGFYVHGELSSN